MATPAPGAPATLRGWNEQRIRQVGTEYVNVALAAELGTP
jgi:hypothetical protein